MFNILIIILFPNRRQSRSENFKARMREHARTTRMLVVVITLFLITELPQGFLTLCSGSMRGFHHAVYTPLGDIMDLVALVNNAINFTCYCTMSKQFRQTFLKLFCPQHSQPEIVTVRLYI